jgi:hypothetical protein
MLIGAVTDFTDGISDARVEEVSNLLLRPGYVRYCIEFEVPTVVVMNVAIFWDIVPCSPYVNRRCGGK